MLLDPVASQLRDGLSAWHVGLKAQTRREAWWSAGRRQGWRWARSKTGWQVAIGWAEDPVKQTSSPRQRPLRHRLDSTSRTSARRGNADRQRRLAKSGSYTAMSLPAAGSLPGCGAVSRSRSVQVGRPATNSSRTRTKGAARAQIDPATEEPGGSANEGKGTGRPGVSASGRAKPDRNSCVASSISARRPGAPHHSHRPPVRADPCELTRMAAFRRPANPRDTRPRSTECDRGSRSAKAGLAPTNHGLGISRRCSIVTQVLLPATFCCSGHAGAAR